LCPFKSGIGLKGADSVTNSLAHPLHFVFEKFVVTTLVVSTFGWASSRLRADECPSPGLIGYTDYFVGTQLTRYNELVSRTGTIGIAECGEFIVAYEALDGTEVLLVLCEGEEQYEEWISAYTGIYARRFYPNGDPYSGGPYCLTISGTEIHSFDAYQGFADPSLAVSRSGQVSVVFTGWASAPNTRRPTRPTAP
jgi:hypothetical protein